MRDLLENGYHTIKAHIMPNVYHLSFLESADVSQAVVRNQDLKNTQGKADDNAVKIRQTDFAVGNASWLYRIADMERDYEDSRVKMLMYVSQTTVSKGCGTGSVRIVTVSGLCLSSANYDIRATVLTLKSSWPETPDLDKEGRKTEI